MLIPKDWELQEDGSYIDDTGDSFTSEGVRIPFTKVDVEHPGSVREGETLRQYRDRVDKAKEKGFHLGDLSWPQWHDYCNASEE